MVADALYYGGYGEDEQVFTFLTPIYARIHSIMCQYHYYIKNVLLMQRCKSNQLCDMVT